MAKKVILVDDIDGKEIDSGFEAPVEFSFDGKYYKLDLRQSNYEAFQEDLKKWIDAAEEVSPSGAARGRRDPARGPKPGSTRADTGSGRSKEELAAIREWAQKNGHEVSPRGRIASPILEAYDEAHKAKS
ncbi:Lsr2 family protein [Nocardia sp. NPDC050697]|uniref:histone-like nucleoid-structuring protein Lsr2 n=1 Tax=Nocardia sp. NPDC050697 TaxID=3155158 RepID=UPI0033C18769